MAATTGDYGRHRLTSTLDIEVIPLPGGGRLNGTHLMVAAGVDDAFQDLDLDRGRLQLLRWSHLRSLAVYRDRDRGAPLGLELGGLSMPFALAGKKESRNWWIAHVGLDAGFAWYDREFDAVDNGMGANLDVGGRLDEQVDLWWPRLSVRAWQAASYRLLVGQFNEATALRATHEVRLEGGLGIYLDITAEPLFRDVPRTDPASGEVTYRRSVNQGKRWRWMIANISGHWHPIGDYTGRPHQWTVATGLERRY